MGQIVELPDDRTVEFPDDFTVDRMNEEIWKQFPELRPGAATKAAYAIPGMSAYGQAMAGQKLPTAGVPAVTVPEFGEEGTFTRGASKAAKMLIEGATTPEGIALLGAAPVPGAARVLGMAMAGAAAKDVGQKMGEYSVTENPELLGEAAVTGTAGALAGALGVREGIQARRQALLPETAKTIETELVPPETIPPERRLAGTGQRMPEFTETTLDPTATSARALPAPGDSTATFAVLPGSELGPRTAGYRISLPVEPATAKLARERWSKPIDIDAQVEGIDAIKQLASMTEEVKTPGQPYQAPTINVDLRQLERVMQRNTVSKVEGWADDVIKQKLTDVSANPFFDPEFMAAAFVKGAVLTKRGVVNFTAWSNEMRKQFGPGMDEKLPEIFRQSIAGLGDRASKTADGSPSPPAEMTTPTAKPSSPAPVVQEGTPAVETTPAVKPSEPVSPPIAAPKPDVWTPEALTTPASKTLGAVSGSAPISSAAKSLGTRLRAGFKVGGNIPPEVHEVWKKAQGEIGSLDRSIRVNSEALGNALSEVFQYGKVARAGGGSKRIPVAAVQEMDAYMKGDPTAKPPPQVRGVLDTFRAEIDGMTDRVIDVYNKERGKHPMGSPAYEKLSDMIDLMRGNKGIYAHRSYKFFDQPKFPWEKQASPAQWYDELPHNVRTTAEDYVINNSPTPIPRAEAQSLLLNWLNDLRETPHFGTGKLGSKDLSIFMKRKVIAPEIRAVLGEYQNPLINYAKSVYKMGNFVARQNFLNEAKRLGMGRYLFEEGANPPGFNTKIAGPSSETMSPLNGLRTSEPIAEAFKAFNEAQDAGAVARAYYWANAWTKQMATTHSLMTQVRNLLSRPMMAAMAGHWRVSELGPALRAVHAEFNAKQSPFVDMLYKRGILGDTAQVGEIKALLNDAMLNDVAPADLHTFSLWRAAKHYGMEVPREVYRISDELGNVFGFLNERANQKKINPKWTPDQIDTEAARITRNLYPYYSETPKVVQGFRKVPLVGPFVTFQYQMYRTLGNSVAQAIKEVKSANPAERQVGYTRLGGQLATIAAPYALMEASKALHGISTQQEQDFRRTQPFWSNDSAFFFFGRDPKTGELDVLNLSYLSPYNAATDPFASVLYALREDASPDEALINAIGEAARPWVSEQMLANALLEVRAGRTDTGTEIFNKTDPWDEKSQKIIAHVGKTFLPGTVQRIQKRIIPAARNEQPPYSRKLELGPEIAREMTGVGFEKVNFLNFIAHRAPVFKSLDLDAEGVFHKVLSRTQTTTPDDLYAAYVDADTRRMEVWKDMRKDLMAALRSGITLRDATRTMKARGMTEIDTAAIAKGRYLPMPISEETKQRAAERKRILPMDRIRARRKLVGGMSLDDDTPSN